MKRAPDVPRAGKEMVLSATKLTNPEARFLVSNYYAAQDARKRSDMQIRHMGDNVALPEVLSYSRDGNAVIEGQVMKCLESWANGSPVGRWCLAQFGVGPVLAAGFLAHLDIERAPTAGHFWSFAGQNPEMKWGKGEKRPYNADLKQLCYHFGECAKRTSNNPDSFYGRIYRDRKEYVVAKNDAGGNAERAKTFTTKSADWKATLAKGKLPDGNLDRQAGNYAAKIFLSHLHAVMYWDHYKKAPPKPFAIAHQGHAHEIKIPHMDLFPGFAEAYYGAAVKQDNAPHVPQKKRAAVAA